MWARVGEGTATVQGSDSTVWSPGRPRAGLVTKGLVAVAHGPPSFARSASRQYGRTNRTRMSIVAENLLSRQLLSAGRDRRCC